RPEADRRCPVRPRSHDRTRLRAGGDDALHGAGAPRAGRPRREDLRLDGAEHDLRPRLLRPLSARFDVDLPRRPGLGWGRPGAAAGGEGAVTEGAKPTLAVWKFASCDGCQLSLLDCEDELLRLAGEVEIAYFLEARRAAAEGPYDLSLVE